jgi:hypothetical protein
VVKDLVGDVPDVGVVVSGIGAEEEGLAEDDETEEPDGRKRQDNQGCLEPRVPQTQTFAI